MQKYLEQPRPGAGPARTELLRQAAANQSMPGGLRPGGAASKGANGRQARVRKLSGVQGCQVLSAALAFLSLVLPCACEPACVTHIPIHDLIRQPGNVLWFADGRNITVEQYNIGGCETDKQHPSGVMFVGNYSVLSQKSNASSEACLVGTSVLNKEAVYRSMQALVLRTNGFKLAASSIDVEDIDSDGGGLVNGTTRDSAVVFGMQNGSPVHASPMLYADSVLRLRDYVIPARLMRQLGFKREYLRVTGAEHGADGADGAHNCPLGHVAGAEQARVSRCKLTASFAAGIDTLVVMHAVAQKGGGAGGVARSATLVSELRLRCSGEGGRLVSHGH